MNRFQGVVKGVSVKAVADKDTGTLRQFLSFQVDAPLKDELLTFLGGMTGLVVDVTMQESQIEMFPKGKKGAPSL